MPYHGEAVPDPEAVPVVWALRDVHVLAVHGHHVGARLAHHAPGDAQKKWGNQHIFNGYEHVTWRCTP